MKTDQHSRRESLYTKIALWTTGGSVILAVSISVAENFWYTTLKSTVAEAWRVGLAVFTAQVFLALGVRFLNRRYNRQIRKVGAFLASLALLTWHTSTWPFRAGLKGVLPFALWIISNVVPLFIGAMIAISLNLRANAWIPVLGCYILWEVMRTFEKRQIEIQNQLTEILSELRSRSR